MKPYYESGGIQIFHGDCLEVLPHIGLVDSVVCDPPWGISFMNQKWDHAVPGVEYWRAVKDVMKPGAHLLAMGGTRTFHRLACAIEDAGLEVRDCICYLFGSGFPKSLDVGKAIDRAAGIKREKTGRVLSVTGNRKKPSSAMNSSGGLGAVGVGPQEHHETIPATDAAKQWNGWGTALKPAAELICLARKPLSEKTVAANVLKHGTGALNIDGCRISTGDKLGGGAEKGITTKGKHEGWKRPWMNDEGAVERYAARARDRVGKAESQGRWPANVLHDGSEEVLAGFPKAGGGDKRGECHGKSASGFFNVGAKGRSTEPHGQVYDDNGSAARFFFCAKTSPSERGNSDHPTQKPVALMRYLCRLITPPGGVVLDPFMGSGSTLVAAQAESFRAVGIELEEKYCGVAANRLSQQVFDFDGGNK